MRQKVAAYNLFKGGCSFYYNYRDRISGLSNEKMGPALIIIPLQFAASPYFIVNMSRRLFMYNTQAFTPSVEQKIIEAEETGYFQQMIDQLPEKCREVTYMHFYKGFSRNQMAEALQVSKSTVQYRLSYSIYLLKIFVLKHKPGE